jgi:hypothetical protein
MVGGHKVKKFAFSPFTAKAKQAYTFYADVVLKVGIESPPGSGKQRRDITVIAHVGTYIEFRDAVLSGEIGERVAAIVTAMGGGEIESVAYWRNNKAERVETDSEDTDGG